MFRVFQFVYLSITNAKTADAKLAKGLQWAPVWSYRQSKSISWKHVWQKHHCKDGEEKYHNTEKLAKKYVGLVEICRARCHSVIHSKSESRDYNDPAKKLNFPQICPKMPQNDPKMTKNGPKWPKNDPK